MKLYVASSWRCAEYAEILKILRMAGHQCYDFKDASHAFSWAYVDEKWKTWNFQEYLQALQHPKSIEGFQNDFGGMYDADACVLVQPCGVSAHIEAGWFAGRNRPVFSIGMPREPDLMLSTFFKLIENTEEGRTTLLRNLYWLNEAVRTRRETGWSLCIGDEYHFGGEYQRLPLEVVRSDEYIEFIARYEFMQQEGRSFVETPQHREVLDDLIKQVRRMVGLKTT